MTKSTINWRVEYPFTSRYMPLQKLEYHYVDEGSGPPVVLVHGNPTWSFYYRHLITGMSPRWRCIAPDHIGCGLSSKPQKYAYTLETHIRNLEALLFQHLKLERFTLVMHDWGGAIGMGVAVRHPRAIANLVIMNSAAFPMTEGCPKRIRLCQWPVFGSVAMRGLNVFSRAALRMAVQDRTCLSPEARAGLLAPYDSWANRVGVFRFVQDIPLGQEHPTWNTLNMIEHHLRMFRQTPTVFFWGDRDFCFTPAFLKRWLEFLPHAQVRRFPDAGHYVLEEAHAQILPLLTQFLEDHP